MGETVEVLRGLVALCLASGLVFFPVFSFAPCIKTGAGIHSRLSSRVVASQASIISLLHDCDLPQSFGYSRSATFIFGFGASFFFFFVRSSDLKGVERQETGRDWLLVGCYLTAAYF